MVKLTHVFFFVFVSALLAGCSSTTLTASWKNPEFTGALDRIYIVGVSTNNTTRRLFEDSFSQELATLGVNGIVSYKDIPKEQDNKDMVMSMAKENRTDSILICRMVKKRTETIVTPGRITTYGRGYYPEYPYYPYYYYPYYSSYDAYYSRRYETIYEPPTVNQYDIATIEANMYDTRSGELIWTAQLEITTNGNLQKIIMDFIKIVINDLKVKVLI